MRGANLKLLYRKRSMKFSPSGNVTLKIILWLVDIWKTHRCKTFARLAVFCHTHTNKGKWRARWDLNPGPPAPQAGVIIRQHGKNPVILDLTIVLDDEPLRLACKTAISVFRLAVSENFSTTFYPSCSVYQVWRNFCVNHEINYL